LNRGKLKIKKMGKKEISEKELKIIEEIAKNKGITQRELSRRA